MQSQAGPSRKTALMVVAIPTVVRFLGFVERVRGFLLVTRVVLCCLSSGRQGYVDWRTRLDMCCGSPFMRLSSELAQDCARKRCRK
jgi:hypothetical protein